MGKIYHVVDSIKGGCGKTTFSIMLCEYLERKIENENEHACLLDMDFLGTGMQDLLLTKEDKENFPKEYNYITDKIRVIQENDKKFIKAVKVQDRILYVGFSNPLYRAKEEYRFTSKYNYAPIVKYGIFRSGIRSLLSGEELEKNVLGVKHVVIDMSPSSDAYSESVKDCLFDKKYSNFMKEKDLCYYYLMVGMDGGHVGTAKDYLRDFMIASDRMPDKIFVVFNDIMRIVNADEKKEVQEQYDGRIQEFKARLSKIPKKKLKNIYFISLNYFTEYIKKTHTMRALCEPPKPGDREEIFQAIPFQCACLYKGSMRKVITATSTVNEGEISENEILEWITKDK